jgi:hypothetical protein
MVDRWLHALHLVVAADSLSLVRRRGVWRPQGERLISLSGDATGPQVWQDWCIALKGLDLGRRSVHVLVADELVRYWSTVPPANAMRSVDFEAAARWRFTELFDDSADDWVVSVQPRLGSSFLACAVHKPVHQLMLSALGDLNWTALSVMPESVAKWNHWCAHVPKGGWLALLQGAELRLMMTDAEGLSAIRSVPCFSELHGQPDGLEQLVQREAWRHGVSMPTSVQWCGELPRAWVVQGGGLLPREVLSARSDALGLLGVPA